MPQLRAASSCLFVSTIFIQFLALVVLAETHVTAVQRTEMDPTLQPYSLDSGQVQLELCDCQSASGAPGGLSCDKEGFFIASFERQGQWVAGGGSVPLSRAICCRPCLPDSLPDDPSGRLMRDGRDLQALAVVSVGCHASIETLGVRCEQNAGSFVSGFTDAVRVFTSADTLYPIDTAQCCTPALLLDSGDAWELERCGCHPSEDSSYPVNCGGNATDEALTGFDYFRLSPMGQVVPIGPARCCGMCLSKAVHPISHCQDLNRCSGNGVCLMGRCECLAGWGSADCSLPVGTGKWGGRVPPWAIALIVIGSCILAIVLLSVVAHIAEMIAEARERDDDESNDGDGVRRPLILHIDADDTGSVGSVDTESSDEIEEVEDRIEEVIHRLEASATRTDEEEEQQHHNDGEGTGVEGDSRGGEEGGGGAEYVSSHRIPIPAPTSPASEEENERQRSGVVAPDVEAGTPEAEDETKGALRSYAGVGPLSAVDCTVCMIRPVQTVVIPCGHVCMCRRCSRRLRRCPICRSGIARRQRLFV